jgi:hypothetical protein
VEQRPPIAAPRTSHHHQSPKVQTGLSVFLLNKYGVPLIVFAQQTQHFLPLAWKKDNNVLLLSAKNQMNIKNLPQCLFIGIENKISCSF